MEKCEVQSWDDAGVRVVQVSGEFDIAACKRFRAASDRDDAELTVVDLRRTTFLDSCALGELISLHRRVVARKARLGILRPEGHADRLFKLTGIESHLPLYDDRVPLLAEFNYG
jgi:anti-anti-sigma factor